MQYDLIPSLYRIACDGRREYEVVFDKVQMNMVETVPDLRSAIEKIVKAALMGVPPKYNDIGIISESIMEIVLARFAELYLAECFLIEANRNGFEVPTLKLFKDQHVDIKSIEYLYLHIDTYIKKLRETIGIVPQINRELLEYEYPVAMALARHHGIHSRYLDWTTDPMVAAYFAAEGGDYTSSTDLCVWAINIDYLKSFTGNKQFRLHNKLPHKGLEYLHRQKGLFTEMVGYEGYYFNNQKWPTLLEYISQPDSYDDCSENIKYVKKIIINRNEAAKIISVLDRKGINLVSIMPSYDNIATLIKLRVMNEV